MGKPTGFLEFARQANDRVQPLIRLAGYDEFYAPLAMEERQRQGARCMDCGVPFCQSGVLLGGAVSGCPLHNLIPEWNDMIYRGNWRHALERLLKTNNFPEFTGRVCPALCEAACTCGLHGDPVTVRDNELAMIEYGFAHGEIKPFLPRVRTGKRVAVIGSGPSGLAVADQLNRRGHFVTVFEREDRIGGLLMYGIPNMKLDKSVVERRVQLMAREGVCFVPGADIGQTVPAERILAEFDAVVLCCGANNPRDLQIPGRELEGVHFAVDFLKSTTKSLLNSGLTDGNFISAEGRDVLIVGGGDTGNDCVGTCLRQGCKSVVQLEMMPCPPEARAESNPWPEWPRVKKTDYGQEEAIARFGHDPRVYQATVKEFLGDAEGRLQAAKVVQLQAVPDGDTGRMQMREIPGTEEILPTQLVLIAAGFLGCQRYVADAFGTGLTPRSNVATEPEGYFTGIEKVFVAGDMHRGQSLVVWAIAEGRAAAREVDEYLMGYSNMRL